MYVLKWIFLRTHPFCPLQDCSLDFESLLYTVNHGKVRKVSQHTMNRGGSGWNYILPETTVWYTFLTDIYFQLMLTWHQKSNIILHFTFFEKFLMLTCPCSRPFSPANGAICKCNFRNVKCFIFLNQNVTCSFFPW